MSISESCVRNRRATTLERAIALALDRAQSIGRIEGCDLTSPHYLGWPNRVRSVATRLTILLLLSSLPSPLVVGIPLVSAGSWYMRPTETV